MTPRKIARHGRLVWVGLMVVVAAAAGGEPVLSWAGGVLTCGDAEMVRQWKLVGGLPCATSLAFAGEEWLLPTPQPTTGLPPGYRLQPPFQIKWTEESGRETPTEMRSRRGLLSVMGSDGSGYRWHLKIFAGLAAVTERFEFFGGSASDKANDPAADLEKAPAAGLVAPPASDRLEWFNLAAANDNLVVVDLADITDQHDNLASERTFRLSPKERVSAATDLCAVEDPSTGRGLVLLKHAPLPGSRPVPTAVDVVGGYRSVSLYGYGAGAEGQGYSWSVMGYVGGKWGRARALHALQARLLDCRPGTNGLMVSNTWGDCNRDARVNAAFVRTEIAAGRELGIDVCQVDDGWQEGLTSNSAFKSKAKGIWGVGYWASDAHFWSPRPAGFPAGFGPVLAAAKQAGMGLGLWFSPDGADEYANWQKDAEAVTGFYRNWNVTKVKLDGMKVTTKRAEINLHRLVDQVTRETEGGVIFDLDVTNGVRPGYFGLVQADIFMENRYSDWHTWWPHSTLRNLWQLSWYVSPQRLRVEFLNPERNADKYRGDPLAPANYPPEYGCATTLMANPLAWFEVSGLSPKVAQPMRALIAVWKKNRAELQAGEILPVGDCPSGAAWTGFCSATPHTAQVMIFRERTTTAETAIELPIPDGNWSVERLAGTGAAKFTGDRLKVSVPEQLRYLWVRLVRLPAADTSTDSAIPSAVSPGAR